MAKIISQNFNMMFAAESSMLRVKLLDNPALVLSQFAIPPDNPDAFSQGLSLTVKRTCRQNKVQAACRSNVS